MESSYFSYYKITCKFRYTHKNSAKIRKLCTPSDIKIALRIINKNVKCLLSIYD